MIIPLVGAAAWVHLADTDLAAAAFAAAKVAGLAALVGATRSAIGGAALAILAGAALAVAALGAGAAVLGAAGAGLCVGIAGAVAAARSAAHAVQTAGTLRAKLGVVWGLAILTAHRRVGAHADGRAGGAAGLVAVLGLGVALLAAWTVVFDQAGGGWTGAGVGQHRIAIGVQAPQVIALGVAQRV